MSSRRYKLHVNNVISNHFSTLMEINFFEFLYMYVKKDSKGTFSGLLLSEIAVIYIFSRIFDFLSTGWNWKEVASSA